MKKILMASMVLSILAAAIFMVQISSCTKTTAQTKTIYDTVKVIVRDTFCPNTYPITGLWVGNYSVDSKFNIPGSFDYSFTIYPDGTFLTRSKQASNVYYGSGTWKLSNNNIFTATSVSFPSNSDPVPVTQVFKATFSNIGILLGSNRDSINTNGTHLSYTYNLKRINY